MNIYEGTSDEELNKFIESTKHAPQFDESPTEQVQEALPGYTSEQEANEAIDDVQKQDAGTTGQQEAANIIKSNIDYKVSPEDINNLDPDYSEFDDMSDDELSKYVNDMKYNKDFEEDEEAKREKHYQDVTQPFGANDLRPKEKSDEELNNIAISNKHEMMQALNNNKDPSQIRSILGNGHWGNNIAKSRKELFSRNMENMSDEDIANSSTRAQKKYIKKLARAESAYRQNGGKYDYMTADIFLKPSKYMSDERLNNIKQYWESALKDPKFTNKKLAKSSLNKVNNVIDDKDFAKYDPDNARLPDEAFIPSSSSYYIHNAEKPEANADNEEVVDNTEKATPNNDENAQLKSKAKDVVKGKAKDVVKGKAKDVAKNIAKGALGKLMGNTDGSGMSQLDYNVNDSIGNSLGNNRANSGANSSFRGGGVSVPHYEDDTSPLTSSNIEKPNKYDWHNTNKTSFSGRMGVAAIMTQLAAKKAQSSASSSGTPHYEDIDDGQVDQAFEKQDVGPEAKFIKAAKSGSSSPMVQDAKQGKISISNGSLLAGLIQKIQRVYKTWDESQGRYYKNINDDIKISTADGISVLVNGKSLTNIDEATAKVINSAL